MKKTVLFALSILLLYSFCSTGEKDESAKAMRGAYAALLTKYDKLLKEAQSDSAYGALLQNKQADLEKLLEQYQDRESSDLLEIVRSRVLLEIGEHEKAIEKLNPLIQQDTDLAKEATFYKVKALQESGQMVQALEEFKQIEDKIELNEEVAAVMFQFAFAAPDLQDQENFSRRLLNTPNWPEKYLNYKVSLYQNLALIAKERDNLREARRILNEGIDKLGDSLSVSSLESTLDLLDMLGQPAPEIYAETWLNSGSVKLKELQGKVILIDFWATWCYPCRKVIPTLVDLYQDYKDDGLRVIGYTRLYGNYRDDIQRIGAVEPRDEIRLTKDFVRRWEMDYPVAIAHSQEIFERYSVSGIPTLFFIDEKGVLTDFKIGSGNEERIREKVKTLL